MEVVKKIIEDVKKNGDKAVRKYTEIFDKIKIKNFKVNKRDIAEAYKKVDKETIKAIKSAARNIREFAGAQFKNFKDFEYTKNGITVGQKIIPIEKIGVYVPGGNYPLPSTALMCIIPAKVAGVKEVIVCSPKIKPVTIVSANLAGADKIFNVGGVQAIAAMAYGTKTIPKVDKVVGPGNIYVTQAKKEIFGDCGIDLLAGPTEILLIADRSSNPKFIAADLLAQAEHDINTKIIFVTDSKELIKNVNNEIKFQIKKLETKKIIKEAFKKKKVIFVKNLKGAVKIANEVAPEHLALQVKNPRRYLNQLKNYGSLFLGEYSAVAFGDYCSGTNHVLPTDKTSRYTGGLSVKDFLKIQTYQLIDKKGAKNLAKIATKFASLEGLDGHKKSAEIRFKND
ncbi:MAG: histidinol dehydrogenase [Candidatus Nealsonbacteria bacterium CG02_land_8_20_14_3_00_37_10]|uniref:Histidinol dehydrogenase n=2 Tax=Candidatus Nealsoniibacteriota TaxID=1817911 RepID=A0A2G9Z056_9BACT|nr:MAG: histidinol dehydrogenase [Candidatus Nealsonbacteria bacterium CG23_combo_of_CG06-09_8_20_14_all_37_18]PIV45360.1 MAG: histidinol dehydrogenase [Candidatus Nealsonbacteria bacterium CG02_land_8_20_14_3_00_37_10]